MAPTIRGFSWASAEPINRIIKKAARAFISEAGEGTMVRMSSESEVARIQHRSFDNLNRLSGFTEVWTPRRDCFEVFRNPIQNFFDCMRVIHRRAEQAA